MKRRAMISVALAGLFFLTACPDPKPVEKLWTRKSNLSFRVQQYHECFYWKEFERAALFVAPDKRQEFLSFVEQYRQGYSLENFVIKKIEISPTGDNAAVVVKRSFVLASSVKPQTEEVIQNWVRLKGEWFVAGPPY